MAITKRTALPIHVSNLRVFPRATNNVCTAIPRPTRKEKSEVSNVIEIAKTGICPTCNEPANAQDGILCHGCGAFLCASPACECRPCDRIQKIVERTVLDMLRHPKMYGL